MALRAFKNNPSIGGFGNESSSFLLATKNRNHVEIDKSNRLIKEKSNKRESSSQHDAISNNNRKENTKCSSRKGGKNKKKIMSSSSTSSYHYHQQGRSRTSSASSTTSATGSDAFAQIVKELVDNAVDACRMSTVVNHTIDTDEDMNTMNSRTTKKDRENVEAGSTSLSLLKKSPSSVHNNCIQSNKKLKRVRVSIEKVINLNMNRIGQNRNTNNTTTAKGCESSNDDNSEKEKENQAANKDKYETSTCNDNNQEVLRVTVTDNGCGMEDIEHCVSVFSSTKGEGTNIDNTSSRTSSSTHNHNNRNRNLSPPSNAKNHSEEVQICTAGRYGLGLTLCLLHAQRLVPNSCASITSSTSKQNVWTVAKFVVDTERDVVVCVDKKLKEKKKDSCSDSGTAVSLLVPGGKEAQNAWPRLAEYFARFQLSFGLQCSLEVMAPSLSSRPLFIRPIYEMKQHYHERQNGQRDQSSPLEIMGEIDELEPHRIHTLDDGDNDEDSIASDLKSNLKVADDSSYIDIDGNEGIMDWIASSEESKQTNEILSTSHSFHPREKTRSIEKENDDEWIDILNKSDDQYAESQKKESDETIDEKINQKESISTQDQSSKKMGRQNFIQAAVTKYLQKSISAHNFAHSSQPIRVDVQLPQSSKNGTCPTLEVDMIVCSDNDESSDDDDYDDFGADDDSESAKMFVIRMVNHIPLLDGGEALACGVIKGVAEKRALWNSFGLDVSPLGQSPLSKSRKSSSSLKNGEPSNTSLLHIPTFSIRDNAQVAHYFTTRNHIHSRFEEDYSDDDDELTCDSYDHGKRSGKRKKKQRQLLLPAELRLGKILLIVQLHAKPMHLPMPTLSKGRLPMNNRHIDEALELCISSCLKNLQKSNPSLLLTASQLKKSERDSRFLPSIAEAMTSMVMNCNDNEIQEDMLGILRGWKEHTSQESMSIITPALIDLQLSCRSQSTDDLLQKRQQDLHDLEGGGEEKKEAITILDSTNGSMPQQLSKTIESRFRRVIKVVEERKIEQSKKARAEYSHKKKKENTHGEESEASSSCASIEDLDAFIGAADNKLSQTSDATHSVSGKKDSSRVDDYECESLSLNRSDNGLCDLLIDSPSSKSNQCQNCDHSPRLWYDKSKSNNQKVQDEIHDMKSTTITPNSFNDFDGDDWF